MTKEKKNQKTEEKNEAEVENSNQVTEESPLKSKKPHKKSRIIDAENKLEELNEVSYQ